ncbi:hypothetical protein [Streptomyces sp. ICBB 8177]|uniref:hypothetical protein n=1 Tax=Streptomyces sp. ICBB 8177 TaxID=563922 RepID=UPI000D67F4E0|nr:hypothetical protein [Streptomyces sp. ICBB 8177]PWI41372.1 hypothetical protein CK485_20930 [Streptomyces sp. ICBB 8177]
MHEYVAAEAGQGFGWSRLLTAALGFAFLVVLIRVGRAQRRTGRSVLSPGEPMECGDRLVQPPPPRTVHRVVGWVFTVVGWTGVAFFGVTAVALVLSRVLPK